VLFVRNPRVVSNGMSVPAVYGLHARRDYERCDDDYERDEPQASRRTIPRSSAVARNGAVHDRSRAVGIAPAGVPLGRVAAAVVVMPEVRTAFRAERHGPGLDLSFQNSYASTAKRVPASTGAGLDLRPIGRCENLASKRPLQI
jgi:hypothetical protein